MERTAWTDERLDDMSKRMDAGFARVDTDIRELRGDVAAFRSEIRAELRSEIGGLRMEMSKEFGALRTTMSRFGGGLIVTLIGVFATLLARGI
jgi:hypothetical protein